MRRELEVEAPKIKTYVLKVHVNCQGCRHKVKKLLSKIDGVYKVKIDPEEQLVTVSGKVDPKILIRKLANCGKRAELLATDSKKDIRSLVHGLSSMYNDDEPTRLTFCGAQVEDNIDMKPWMADFNRGILNRGVTGNMFPFWDYADTSSRPERDGVFPDYAIGTGRYGDPASGFPSYHYPPFSPQDGSQLHYNYPPIESISIMASYSPMFSLASPYAY